MLPQPFCVNSKFSKFRGGRHQLWQAEAPRQSMIPDETARLQQVLDIGGVKESGRPASRREYCGVSIPLREGCTHLHNRSSSLWLCISRRYLRLEPSAVRSMRAPRAKASDRKEIAVTSNPATPPRFENERVSGVD